MFDPCLKRLRELKNLVDYKEFQYGIYFILKIFDENNYYSIFI